MVSIILLYVKSHFDPMKSLQNPHFTRLLMISQHVPCFFGPKKRRSKAVLQPQEQLSRHRLARCHGQPNSGAVADDRWRAGGGKPTMNGE